MPTVQEQLRSLYTPEELVALDKVSGILRANPAALDNRKEEHGTGTEEAA